MEAPTAVLIAVCALTLITGLIIGYQIGARRGRDRRRALQQELNHQSLELLDARGDHKRLVRFLGAAKRKDRLLKLTLIKLKSSNALVRTLRKQFKDAERRHYIETSRLNMSLMESRQRVKQATEVAKEACFRLRLLEKALPQLPTITAPEPKSYGHGEAVTVSVVDQHTPGARQEQVSQVGNRDLQRLTNLEPSNEQVRTRSDNTVALHAAAANASDERKSAALEQTLNKNETASSAT